MGDLREDTKPNMNILLKDLSPNITETIAIRMSTPHFSKDWKSLSGKFGYNIRDIEVFALENQANPCLAMLKHWQKRENTTVRFLDNILLEMGRYDVSQELCDLMKKDTRLIVYIEGANDERKISVEVSGQSTLENALSDALREENLQVSDLSITSPTQVVPVNWDTPAHYFQGVEIRVRLNQNSDSYRDTRVVRCPYCTRCFMDVGRDGTGACVIPSNTDNCNYSPSATLHLPKDSSQLPHEAFNSNNSAGTLTSALRRENHPTEHDEGNSNGISQPSRCLPTHEHISQPSHWLPTYELCSENHLIPWYPELSDKSGPISMFFGRYIQEDGWYLFKYYEMKKLGLCVTHSKRVLLFLVHWSSNRQFFIDRGDFKASSLEDLVRHYHNHSFPRRSLQYKNIDHLTLKSPLNRDVRRTSDDPIEHSKH